MKHHSFSGAWARRAGLGFLFAAFLGTGASPAEGGIFRESRIDLATERSKCERGAALLRAPAAQRTLSADDKKRARARLAACAIDRGDWALLGQILEDGDRTPYDTRADIIANVAMFAYGTLSTERFFALLGDNWARANPVRSWSPRRTAATVKHDAGWLRAHARSCAAALPADWRSVQWEELLRCVASAPVPDVIKAEEAELLAAERARAAAEAARVRKIEAEAEASRQAAFTAEIAAGACAPDHLRAMQDHLQGYKQLRMSLLLLQHEIFVLDSVGEFTLTPRVAGSYRVWVTGVDRVQVEVHNAKGQRQPADPTAVSLTWGVHTVGASLLANAGDTFRVQIKGRGCAALLFAFG
jgi:hypothetical protein